MPSPKGENFTILFLLESPNNKNFQHPDIKIDFLIDSGAESNIVHISVYSVH